MGTRCWCQAGSRGCVTSVGAGALRHIPALWDVGNQPPCQGTDFDNKFRLWMNLPKVSTGRQTPWPVNSENPGRAAGGVTAPRARHETTAATATSPGQTGCHLSSGTPNPAVTPGSSGGPGGQRARPGGFPRRPRGAWRRPGCGAGASRWKYFAPDALRFPGNRRQGFLVLSAAGTGARRAPSARPLRGSGRARCHRRLRRAFPAPARGSGAATSRPLSQNRTGLFGAAPRA